MAKKTPSPKVPKRAAPKAQKSQKNGPAKAEGSSMGKLLTASMLAPETPETSNPASVPVNKRKWRIKRPKSASVTEGEEIEVYNEYTDDTGGPPYSYDLSDGSTIFAGDSGVETVVVEMYPEGNPNAAVEVMTYGNDATNSEDVYDYVEVDMSYFESFEEYYDEDNNLNYESSDCGSNIGIRG